MYKKVSILLIGILIGSFSFGMVSVFAGQPIKLIVNGNVVNSDVPPQIINGRTMIPARALAEALGATVSWDASQNAVIVTSNGQGASSANSSSAESSLYDDFTKPLSENWDSSILDGRWSVDPVNGAYGASRSYLVLKTEKYPVSQDFTMEADVFPIIKGQGPMQICTEVGFLIGGDKNYGWDQPRIFLTSGSNAAKLVADGYGMDEKWADRITQSNSYKLKVIKRGTDLNVYVNDEYVLLTSLKESNSNLIGIYSFFGGYIKNFRITND